MFTLPKSLNFGRNLRQNVANFVLHPLYAMKLDQGSTFFPVAPNKNEEEQDLFRS